MIKCRKYWGSSPDRDEISVEKADLHALRRPFGDGIRMKKYCVPNGTPCRVCASIFYRYYIPNGMTALKRHFMYNANLKIQKKLFNIKKVFLPLRFNFSRTKKVKHY